MYSLTIALNNESNVRESEIAFTLHFNSLDEKSSTKIHSTLKICEKFIDPEHSFQNTLNDKLIVCLQIQTDRV